MSLFSDAAKAAAQHAAKATASKATEMVEEHMRPSITRHTVGSLGYLEQHGSTHDPQVQRQLNDLNAAALVEQERKLKLKAIEVTARPYLTGGMIAFALMGLFGLIWVTAGRRN